MNLLLMPFKALGWLAMTVLTTAIKTVTAITVVLLVLRLIYWFGVQGTGG